MGHRFDPKHVAKLLNQDRYLLIQPDKILDLLPLHHEDSLADIGCGPGFFLCLLQNVRQDWFRGLMLSLRCRTFYKIA